MNAFLWVSSWLEGFGLEQVESIWILAPLGLIFIFLFIIVTSSMIVAYLDRKVTADFQARVGPNRAGPAGVFQSWADFFKLLQKDRNSEVSWSEELWLAIHTMALYSTVAVLPLGSLMLLVDTDMSVFLPFWAALVVALGTMLLGLSQKTVAGWYGGIRVATQAISGAFPALVAMICVGLRAGSFRWSGLVAIQGAAPLSWTAFSIPFQFIALIVFLVSGLVLLAIPPMDAALSSPDVSGGVAAHLSGRRLVLFKMGRFYSFYLWAVIASVLFLGGWKLPFEISENLLEQGKIQLLHFLELCCLMTKSLILILLVIWGARVNPRTRVDQITDFAWTVLSPFALFALIGASLVAGWGVLS